MQAIDFILNTLSHFARGDDGPPPGVPVSTEGDFERELTWLCEWHAITPIVLGSLEKLALRPRLSRVTLERMKALNRASRGITDDVLGTAHALATRFSDRNVDVRFLGDVVLSTCDYPEEGARPIETIELLVGEDAWSEILDVCREAGFRTDAPLPLFENGLDAMNFFQYFPPCILENERGDRLRLRLRLFEMGEPEASERAWATRRNLPGRLDGAAGVRVEDQLIQSAMGYNMSGFGKLANAVDIGLMLRRYAAEFDWEYATDSVDARSLYPAFYFTLANAVRWLHLTEIDLPLVRPSAVRHKLFDITWPAGRNSFALRRTDEQYRMRFCLVECGKPGEKLRFLGRLLFPRNEWVAAFFREPYKPYLKLKFLFLMLRSRFRATTG